MIGKIEDVLIATECNELMTQYVEEFGTGLDKEWDNFLNSFKHAENGFSYYHNYNNFVSDITSDKKKTVAKLEELSKSEGNLEEIQQYISNCCKEIEQLEHEKEIIQNSCAELQRVIDERKVIIEKNTAEKKIEINKLETQKKKMTLMLMSHQN